MRKAKIYTHGGCSLTLAEWAEQLGIERGTLYARRRKYGDDLDKVLRPGTQKGRALSGPSVITIGDESHTAAEWENILGVSISAIMGRKYRRLPLEKVLHRGHLKSGRDVLPLVTYNNQTLSQAEWARQLGVSRERIRQRLKKYPIDEALSLVRHSGAGRPKKTVTIGSESLTLEELAKRTGISISTIMARVRAGIPLQTACALKSCSGVAILGIKCRHCGRPLRECLGKEENQIDEDYND